jgi:RNA polymerase sigma-70 factor (ECF subfamily)
VEERDIVDKAKTGDTAAFSALVARYRRRAYGYFAMRLGNEDEADDLCQEAFLKAFLHVRGLRESGRFGPWLFAICRNCLRARATTLASEGKTTEALSNEHPAADLSAWENHLALARTSLGLLDPQTRELVCLRHECGLDYARIAKAMGISEVLVKSRLHRARERLRAIRREVEASAFIEPERDIRLKEEIMKNAETIKKAAWILARLSLRLQIELARAAEGNTAFGQDLIGEIAGLGGGKDFLAMIETRLDLREFCDIISYSDSFTERRLIESLEESDPELAEKIKRSTFVLQDLSLFDAKALSALLKAADISDLALGLSGIEHGIRIQILGAMEKAEADTLRDEMARARGGVADYEESRSAVIRAVHTLFASGEIVLRAEGDGMAVAVSERARV